MTIDKDKIKRQLELEGESVQLGVQRYREQVKIHQYLKCHQD